MVRVHSGLPFSSRCPIFYLVCVRDAIPDAKHVEEEQAGRPYRALRPHDS
jgi:hypothetical protein